MGTAVQSRPSDSEFARMVKQFAPIANCIARKFGNDDELQSVAQLAMIETVRGLDGRRVKYARPFTIRRVTNVVLDFVRRRNWAVRRGLEGGCDFIDLIPDKRAADPCRDAAGPEPSALFDFLSPELRRVAVARWEHGARIRDLAEALGVGPNVVIRRLKTARKLIAREMGRTCND